jgi:hypothetical protein
MLPANRCFNKERNMFNVAKFMSVDVALDHIFELLSFLEPPMNAEFSLCYSLNTDECSMETTDLETLPPTMLDLLRDLDAAEGLIAPIINDGVQTFDFQTDLQIIDANYRFPPLVKQDEVFSFAASGITVINNTFANGPYTFPVIIVKTAAFEKFQDEMLDRLKPGKHPGAYTESIAPAIFVEVNF